MDIRGRQVLVTGADGFIGSHLVELLVQHGCRVRALVYYNALNSWGRLDDVASSTRDQVDVVLGDIRDPNGVRHVMRGCDVAFHLAALIGIPYSYHSPDMYVETNITGTLNVLQAARDLGVQRIVHTSTSEVYGSARYVPIDEEHPLQGQSPYSATKIGADQIALSFHRSFETPVAILRPFNNYGPRQSTRAVIPTIVTQIANGTHRLRLGAVHPTRDFTFVTDTARAFIATAEADAAVGEVINIGSEFEISIGETAKAIADLMGAKVEFETEAARVRPAASEVTRLWAATAKAQRLLGWTPAYGGIDGFRRGLRETIEWFLQRERLPRYKAEMYTV